MSEFKNFYPDETPIEKLNNVEVISERVIDNTAVARLIKIDDKKTTYPYIIEVVRKYCSEENINYKSQDFKTQQEAERILAHII